MHEVRVVDSDTLVAWVQVAPEVRLLWRIRVKGIEGGELPSVNGLHGKAVLEALLKSPAAETLHFIGEQTVKDKYGRHVGDVQLADGRLLSHVLLTNGTHWRRDRTGREFR